MTLYWIYEMVSVNVSSNVFGIAHSKVLLTTMPSRVEPKDRQARQHILGMSISPYDAEKCVLHPGLMYNIFHFLRIMLVPAYNCSHHHEIKNSTLAVTVLEWLC